MILASKKIGSVGVDQVKLPLWQTDPDPKIAGRKASYVFEIFTN
jgi:hypothetical protein